MNLTRDLMIGCLRNTLYTPKTGDQWVAGIAALLPISLVVGSVAFELVIGITGVLWLVQSLFIRQDSLQRIRKQAVFWPLVFWIIGIMLSRVTHTFSTIEFFHDLAFLRFAVFVLALVDISERLSIDRYLLTGAVAGIVWNAFNTFCAYAVGFDVMGDPVVNYTDKLLNAERVAVFCSYMFPFFMVRFISGKDMKKSEKSFLYIVIVLSLGLLILMKIRTVWLAAGIGIIGSAIVALRGRGRWLVIGSIAIAIVAGGGLMYYSGYQRGLSSMYDRFWIWKRCLALWMEHPVLGVGVSGFTKAIYQIAVKTNALPYIDINGVVHMDELRQVAHAHNLILQLLASTGIWGLFSFSWLVINATRRWLTNPAVWRAGLGTFPFVLVGNGLTGSSIYDSFYASVVMFFLAWMASSQPAQMSNICDPKTGP